MELKKQMFDLLNSELDILAYEQKKLNEYKLTEAPSQKAIETRQRIIDQRLYLFNELIACLEATNNYFEQTINKVIMDAKKGYYLNKRWQELLNKAIANEVTELGKANIWANAVCNSLLTNKIFY